MIEVLPYEGGLNPISNNTIQTENTTEFSPRVPGHAFTTHCELRSVSLTIERERQRKYQQATTLLIWVESSANVEFIWDRSAPNVHFCDVPFSLTL